MIQFVSSLPKHGRVCVCVFNGYVVYLHNSLQSVHLEKKKKISLCENNIYFEMIRSPLRAWQNRCSSHPSELVYILYLWLWLFLYLPQGQWREESMLNWCLPHCCFISGKHPHTHTHTLMHTPPIPHALTWKRNNLLCCTGQVSACPLCRP